MPISKKGSNIQKPFEKFVHKFTFNHLEIELQKLAKNILNIEIKEIKLGSKGLEVIHKNSELNPN